MGLSLEDGSEALPMADRGGGWFERTVARAGPGTRYRFELEGGLCIPDPASRYNPDDVHGASEVIDPRAFSWEDGAWQGRPWTEAVIYELHVGAFSPEGSFDGVRRRLDHLARAGGHRDRAHAGGGFPGPSQLGLRRGAAVRAGQLLWAARRRSRPWSRPRTARG